MELKVSKGGKLIVFLIRRFSDIDHIVPVVYKFLQNPNHNLAVLCIDPSYNITGNPLIKFLTRNYRIKVDYVYNVYRPTVMHKVLSFFLCSPYCYKNDSSTKNPALSYYLLRPFLKLYKKIFFNWVTRNLAKKKFFDKKWALEFINKFNVSVLVFDWVKYKKNIIHSMLSAAKELKIPTIALPHGVPVWTAKSCNRKDVTGFRKYLFDSIVVPNKNTKDIFSMAGIPQEKIQVIGSARFCPDWTKIYPDIFKGQKHIQANGTNKLLKVVYMESGQIVLKDKEKLINTFKHLCDLDFVELIVKPKARNNKLQTPELNSLNLTVSSAPSYVLLNWADVCLTAPTSIYLEAIIQNKVFIYPKFLFEKTMIFEEANVGWIVNGYDELKNALLKLRAESSYKPYSDENIHKFFTETVHGGIENRDVLTDYTHFILEKSGL